MARKYMFSPKSMGRNRWIYFLIIILIIAAGISSRAFSHYLPKFISQYSGDFLWALMVFFIFGFIFKYKPKLYIAILVLIFSYLIELSQLYHSPWIDAIRQTGFGGLLLGYGFLWSDMVSYTAAVLAGLIMEAIFR